MQTETETEKAVFDDDAYQLMQAEVARARGAIEENYQQTTALAVLRREWQSWRRVLALSPFVAAHLCRQPEALPALIERRVATFDAAAWRRQLFDELSGIENSDAFDRAIRQRRNAEMALIAVRDLQGLASVEQTLAHLSAAADALVAVCLRWQYDKLAQRHGCPLSDGAPMPLVTLAMGKLGGEELNFSSDIDLILAYEKDGATQSAPAPIAYHEFFRRLAQRLHQSLNKTTEDGFVFRVDLRLRPYGNSGPLVMSFDAMEEYYQTQGREWERYAMIKARAMGMDKARGDSLLQRLQPFVYRRYPDFSVIQSLRDIKAMIERETVRQDRQHHLKLGAGGIREVEFIAQVFQLMRGGRDTALRSRSTPAVLRYLAQRGLLRRRESDDLLAAWRFLRNAENRIQMMYDRQEHELPTSAIDQQRLALAMGCAHWQDFSAQLARHRRAVQQCFDNIFAKNGDADDARQPAKLLWLEIDDDQVDVDYFCNAGFKQPEMAAQQVRQLKTKGVYRRLSERGQVLMDELLPAVIVGAGQARNADDVLTRLLAVITAVARRESYLALLVETPMALRQLAKLCAASSWIADVVARYPALLDELVDTRRLYLPPQREDIDAQLARLSADTPPHDVEAQMENLRLFKQAYQLRVAAADIMRTMPLMRVSDHLTWVAEGALHTALAWAWDYLVSRHGAPMYEWRGQRHQAEFGVVGLGKLGGIELGYGSDLDLIFIHDSRGQSQYSDGDKPLENSVFFTRLAQRLLHLLVTLTPSGVLYEVDMRLRPSGKSGLLVSALDAFATYQCEAAWTWEHQALVRARPLAGGARIGDAFGAIRSQVLAQPRQRQPLIDEVTQMRQRMRDELDKSDAAEFDLKQGAGGIVDIEFMVQYIVLAYANEYPALLQFTDNIRLLEVAADVGLVTAQQARLLIEIYRQYRARAHHRVLQGLNQCVAAAEFATQREQTSALWRQLFEHNN